jgi:hypothetical protein
MDEKWKDLESLPPDRTVILRIVEKITGDPVWSRVAYVDEELELTDLEGEDHRIESRTLMPSHWMDLPRP